MMTNAQLATASLDDIVFDGRNQGYGAYELRALYQRHVTRALVIATALCALLLVFPLVAQLLRGQAPAVVPTLVVAAPIDIDLSIPEVVTPQPAAVKPPVTPPQPPTVRNLVPVVVDEKEVPVKEEVPNQADLVDRRIGTQNLEGDPTASEPNLDGLKPGKDEGAVTEAVSSKPYVSVEQMPELPGGGGKEAIVAAIQRAVKYPSQAVANGVEGKVYVSFVVNEKGEIIDLKIMKGLGSGIDEETLRAIKTLPRFIPGKQNGREVSVSFAVPITFKIQ